MNVKKIQKQLDSLYKESLDNAYAYMMDIAVKAMNESDNEVLLFILNELIGYYRVTTKKEEGEKIAYQLICLMLSLGYDQTIEIATTYLNIATMYRAFGDFDKAIRLYQKTEDIYQVLKKDDMRLSAFYNNYSLLFLELKEYKKALTLAHKALDIVEMNQAMAEAAVSYANLAQMYLLINQKKRAKQYVLKSISLFENFTNQDSHYYSALATLGQCYFAYDDYDLALHYYQKALQGVEKVYGHNKDYYTILDNQNKILKEKKRRPQGLEICQKFYETYGKTMINDKFKNYQKYMAIGMFGFGSDCLGYDDEISVDHDFGAGFCILLPQNIYHEIGRDLQEEYNQLPNEFMGIQRKTSLHGKGRVGVFEINSFFLQFLKNYPKTLDDWLFMNEDALLNCTNGLIFDDYYGKVSQIRQYLQYYPEDIRIKKIARAVAKIAQSGQYNYARCMKRHDIVAAQFALNEFVDQTLSLIYLLNKKYKPYYKWSFYGLKDCVILYDIKDCLEKLLQLPPQMKQWHKESAMLNEQDEKIRIIEYICQRIVEELQEEGLTQKNDDFLDNHVKDIMSHIHDENIREKHVMEG